MTLFPKKKPFVFSQKLFSLTFNALSLFYSFYLLFASILFCYLKIFV